jgi:hypothetical protein
MKLITPPLQLNSQGSEVKNLHYILFLFIQKINNPALNDFFNESSFRSRYKTEVFKQLYGKATFKLVDFLQKFLHGREIEGGVVDKPTAEKFNEMLKKFEGLDIKIPEGYLFEVEEADSENNFRIFGRITDSNKTPLGDIVKVEAFDQDIRKSEPLGETNTNSNGYYEIIYRAEQFNRAEFATADVFIRVLLAEKVIGSSIIFFNATKEVEINLTIDNEHYRGKSEYVLLIEKITNSLDGVLFNELTEKQVDFLSKDTIEPKERIQLLVDAEKLRQPGHTAELIHELLYGM